MMHSLVCALISINPLIVVVCLLFDSNLSIIMTQMMLLRHSEKREKNDEQMLYELLAVIRSHSPYHNVKI